MKHLCILFLCTLFIACGSEPNTYQAPPPPKVTVALPVKEAVTTFKEMTGTTSAFNSVDLQAQVSGYLKKIAFQSGQRVDKGDLLFVIDPQPYQAKLNKAQANLQAQRASLQLAQATLQRKQAAYQDQAVSEVEVIEAKAQKEMAAASVQEAKAQVAEAKINLAFTQIQAPISGRMSRNLVDPGNLITTSTLLATIVDDDPIYAYATISEKDYLELKAQRAQGNGTEPDSEDGHPIFMGLGTNQGYPHAGHIDYVDSQVDSSTGTIQIRAVFANQNQALLPGLFVRLRLPLKTLPNALLLPDAAVSADQRGSYVLVVDAQDTVQYTPVTPGAQKGEMRVISFGLHPQDRVVVKGLQRATPGAQVSPVMTLNKAHPQAAQEGGQG